MAVDVKAQRDLPLFAASEGPVFQEPSPALSEERVGRAVASDYLTTGLTLREHPLALLRPALDRLSLDDTRRVRDARQGQAVRLPGLVLMCQRPGTAKGVVFVTIEDDFGEANLGVNAKVGEQDQAALIGHSR